VDLANWREGEAAAVRRMYDRMRDGPLDLASNVSFIYALDCDYMSYRIEMGIVFCLLPILAKNTFMLILALAAAAAAAAAVRRFVSG
jgi:hypothetical protein